MTDRDNLSIRCPLCYWSLYAVDWCMNKDCRNSGRSVKDKLHISDKEAYMKLKELKSLELVEV
jgi:hypothetical protein